MVSVPSRVGLTWDDGGDASIVTLAGEAVTLRSDKPWAPGSRPTGRLASGEAIRVKVHRSRRDETPSDGATFTVEGRVLDLSRGLRESIAAKLAEASD